MKHALVTGGLGFLGSSICRHLVDTGVQVRAQALPNERPDNVEGLDLEIVRGNVLSIDDSKAAVEGVDTVFHCAAIYKDGMPDPTLMYDVNLRGTFNVLEAARRAGVERVVYTASIASIGRPRAGEVGDETTPYDVWGIDFPYGRSKYHSRVLAEDFAAWGLDVRVVCPGVVLGPGDIGPTPSGKIILNTLTEAPPLYTDGGASYVDVRDAARVHVLAGEKGRPGERYLATAHNLTNLDLLTAIARAAGLQRTYRRVPTRVAQTLISLYGVRARRRGQEPPMSREFFDYSLVPSFYTNRKAVKELGATFRPLDETLQDAIAYFRRRGLVK